MTKEDILQAIGEIDENMALRAEEEKRIGKMNGKKLVVLAVAAALLLSCVTGAFAATNGDLNDLLYRVWPWAAQALKPVNLSCEDQGIRMEVVSASLQENEAVVTLTMQDVTGDRLDETVDLFDSADLQLPYDGSGTCTLLNYDPDTKTAAFALYMKFAQTPTDTDTGKVTFSVSRFLSHKRETTVDLTSLIGDIQEAETVPIPRPVRGIAGKEEAEFNKAGSLKVLNPENSLEIPVTEGVTLTGIGFSEGILHVQMRYDDIFHTDNHGYVILKDKTGNEYGTEEGADGIFSVSWFDRETNGVSFSDSWEEYFFAEYPENLSDAVLIGEFFTADPATEGNWTVTFPLDDIRP